MKKAVVVILLLVLVGVGVAVWYLRKPPQVEMEPARILPQETLFMIELKDLEKGIEDFKSSKLGQSLKQINVGEVIHQLELPPTVEEDYAKGRQSFLEAVDSVLFKELFGREVTIAFLPMEITQPQPEEILKALQSLVLISRPKHKAELFDFFGQIFAKDLECRTQDYAQYKIKSFELDYNLNVYYSVVKDLLIATLDEQTIKNCLDLKKNSSSSLGADKDYRHLRNKLDSSDRKVFAYANMQESYDNIIRIASRLSDEEDKPTVFERSLSGWKGLNALGAASYEETNGLLKQKMLCVLDQEKLDPIYAKAYSFQPEENQTLPMTPADCLMYTWSNTLDLKSFWDMLFTNLAPDSDSQASENLKALMENKLGISIEEVFQAFGNEYGVIVTDIDTAGFLILPKLTLLIETVKQETVANILVSLVQQANMEFIEEDFEGVKIQSLPLPFGADLQPAYVFLDGFFVLSLNPQLVKDVIIANKTNKNITKDPDFKTVNKGLTDKNNTITFIKFDRLLESIKGVMLWNKNMSMLKDPERGKELSLIVDSVFNPVLEGLKMYKTIGSHSCVKGSEIETDNYITIDNSTETSS